MMNGALQNNTTTSYLKTLAGALRVASSWTTSGKPISTGEQHTASLTDTAFVTKAKDPEKGMKTPSVIPDEKKSKRSSSLETIKCFVCGKIGHFAKDYANEFYASLLMYVHGVRKVFLVNDASFLPPCKRAECLSVEFLASLNSIRPACLTDNCLGESCLARPCHQHRCRGFLLSWFLCVMTALHVCVVGMHCTTEAETRCIATNPLWGRVSSHREGEAYDL